jgi:predicted transcriptional regulator of viral defense system
MMDTKTIKEAALKILQAAIKAEITEADSIAKESEILTIKEASEISGLAEITIRKAGRDGRLKIQGGNGAPRRILRKDLYEFLGMSKNKVEGM